MDADVMSAEVAAHFASPTGAGRPVDGGYAHGRAGRIKTGTVIEFWLLYNGELIVDARFETFGCPAAIAAASWLCEYLCSRDRSEAQALRGLDVARALALPPEKAGVALTVEDALKDALSGMVRSTSG